MLITLRSDWTVETSTFTQGSLITVGFEDFDFNLKKSHFLHRNTSDYKNYFNLLYPSNNQFDSGFKINSNILTHTGVSFNDIFNTIYYDLFMDVIKYKWLIYQDTFDDPNHDEIYIKIFNDNLFVPELYLGTKWQELSSEKQISFETKLKSINSIWFRMDTLLMIVRLLILLVHYHLVYHSLLFPKL
jgi:hypothetical protein